MTIKYWPEKQGIDLNLQVSKLFKKLYLKFNFNVYNKTSNVLSIDIVNKQIKKEIFKIILLELEILVLDIVELDVSFEDLEQLNRKILVDLISKSVVNLQLLLNIPKIKVLESDLNSALSRKHIFLEHQFLLQHLLSYLIFGSIHHKIQAYLFVKSKVPTKHVEILLDNLIIQSADIIFYELISTEMSLASLFNFLKLHNICHDGYISIRSIATFKNNLAWSKLMSYYLSYPRGIYNNRYQVWIFTNDGLYSQYIYAYRENDLKTLSGLQIIITVLFELQDFIFPKIQKIVFLFGKVFIYLFRHVIGSVITVLLKSVIRVTSNKTL
jgi:Protein of unknown function (DUF3685)